MSIIISKNGSNAEKVNKSDFDKEDYLQNYIHQNPGSIPVYEISEDKKLFVAIREFVTTSGRIDALAFDADGDIYIVETKLYKNPDKRTVVAQALDYGAALWRHANDFNDFIQSIERGMHDKSNLSFSEKIKEFFNLSDEDVTVVLNTMRQNLNNGNFKFVILMDGIDERLKDLIVYVNQNSQFDIYAVQMEYYKYEEYEIMIPKLFGVEVKKNIKTSSNSERKIWTEEEFLQDAKHKLSSEQFDALKKIYFFSKENADIKFGTGTETASMSPFFKDFSQDRRLFTLKSNGSLMINFNWLREKDLLPEQEERLNKFENDLQLLGFKIDALSTGSDKFNIEQWYKVVDRIIDSIEQRFGK